MSNLEAPRYLVTTYVRPGREADFEAFMKDVVDAGIRRSNPDQAAHIQILRPGAAPHGDARPAHGEDARHGAHRGSRAGRTRCPGAR